MNSNSNDEHEMIRMRKAQPEACIGCRWCMLFYSEMAIDVAEAAGPRPGSSGGTA